MPNSQWKGSSVATIFPKQDSTVYGIATLIPEDKIYLMNKHEGYHEQDKEPSIKSKYLKKDNQKFQISTETGYQNIEGIIYYGNIYVVKADNTDPKKSHNCQ